MGIKELFGFQKQAAKEIPALQTEVRELREVLRAAPTPHEALARPDEYAKWYNGLRKGALGRR